MALPEIKIIISAVGDKLESGVKAAEKRLDGLRGASDRAAARLATLGNRLDRLGRHMSVVSAGIVAGGSAIFAFAAKAADAGDQIGDLSAAAGVSTGYFQEMTFALEQAAAMSDEETSAALARLTRTLGEAQGGSKAATAALTQLGFSAEDIAAGTITTEEAMDRFVQRVGEMKSPTEASALAVDLLGKSGAQAGAMLAGAGDKVQSLRDRARDLGVVLSDKAIAASGEFADSMDDLKRQAHAAMIKIGAELLPLFTETLVPVLRDTVIPAIMALGDKIGEWVEWFNGLPEPVKNAVGAIGMLAAAAGPVVLAIGTISTAISALIAGTGPVGLMIAAVGLVAAAWVAWGDDIKRVVAAAADWIREKFDLVIEKLRGVKQWIDDVVAGFKEILGLGEQMTTAETSAAKAGRYGNNNTRTAPKAGGTGAVGGRYSRGSQSSGGGMDAVGYGMADGLVAGFASGMEERFPVIQTILDGVTTLAREVFQVNSPSRVFAEIGAWLGQGLADGIGSSVGLVSEAVAKTAKAATDGTAGMVSEVLGSLGEMFRGSKAISIAQALVNTWTGATEALKLPFPKNILAFGKTIATGYSAIKNIRGASIGGGSSGGGGASAGASAAEVPVQTFNFSIQNDPFGIGQGIARQMAAALNSASRAGVRIQATVN